LKQKRPLLRAFMLLCGETETRTQEPKPATN
jgi:hypothetical protein